MAISIIKIGSFLRLTLKLQLQALITICFGQSQTIHVFTGYMILLILIFQVIHFSSPASAGAECIDPDCTWVEQWYIYKCFWLFYIYMIAYLVCEDIVFICGYGIEIFAGFIVPDLGKKYTSNQKK